MNKNHTEIVNIGADGAATNLESLSRRLWTGAVRIRTDGAFGVVWFVKGCPVHAAWQRGQAKHSGWAALERIGRWTNGVLLLESGELPPERSIRLEQQVVWERLRGKRGRKRKGTLGGASIRADAPNVDALVADVTSQAPDILFLSAARGRKTAKSGSLSTEEQAWTRQCLRAVSDVHDVRRLIVEDKKRILLVDKTENLHTVVVAKAGTDLQNMLDAVATMKTGTFEKQSADVDTKRATWK